MWPGAVVGRAAGGADGGFGGPAAVGDADGALLLLLAGAGCCGGLAAALGSPASFTSGNSQSCSGAVPSSGAEAVGPGGGSEPEAVVAVTQSW